jgi:uncharacterized protein DUF1573
MRAANRGRERLGQASTDTWIQPAGCARSPARRRVCLLALALALLSSAGCQPTASSTATRTPAAVPASLEMSHHGGEVLAGRAAVHTFTFRNSLSESIRIISDSDIQRTCGCTSIEPSVRVLDPGHTVDVAMSVDTVGREGPLAQRGEILWHSRSGASLAMICRLSTTVKPALTIEPATLAFSESDVDRRQFKEFRLVSHAPVDWSTLQINTSSEYVDLTVASVSSDQSRSATASLRFSIPDDVGNVTVPVVARVRVRPESPGLPSFQAGASATATARHASHLTWKPRVLLFAAEKPIATLWLSGKALSSLENPITSVRLGGSDIHYVVHRTAADGYLLQLELPGKGGTDQSKGDIVVQLTNSESVRIPFIRRKD